MSHGIEVDISVAWWLRWYLSGVLIMSQLTGLQPDPMRVGWWLAKAVSVRVRPGG